MVKNIANTAADASEYGYTYDNHKLHEPIVALCSIRAPVIGAKGADLAAQLDHGQGLVKMSRC